MKCVVCSGRDVELKPVSEEIRVGNDIVCVPVEALVCRACGERYYDRRTVRFLEETEERLKAGGEKLEEIGKVLRYA